MVTHKPDEAWRDDDKGWNMPTVPEQPPQLPGNSPIPPELGTTLLAHILPWCPAPVRPDHLLNPRALGDDGYPVLSQIIWDCGGNVTDWTGVSHSVPDSLSQTDSIGQMYALRRYALRRPESPTGTVALRIGYVTEVWWRRYIEYLSWEYTCQALVALDSITVTPEGVTTGVFTSHLNPEIHLHEHIRRSRYGVTHAEYTGAVRVQPDPHWTSDHSIPIPAASIPWETRMVSTRLLQA